MSFERSPDFFVVLDQLSPLFFSNSEALDVGLRCINEGSPLVEGTTEATDDTFVCVLEAVPSLLVDLVANQYLARVDKHDLTELIKFIVNGCALLLESWFEVDKELKHEVSVRLVVP